MKAIVAISLISGVFLTGCYYDIQEELHPAATGQLCDTGIIKYSMQIKNILSTNCYSCHSSTSASGNISLDNYTGVRSVALNGSLIGSIDHISGFRPMPQNQAILSECDRSTIRKWIENGSTNN